MKTSVLIAFILCVIFFNCASIILVYFIKANEYLDQESLHNTPIYLAFQNPTFIYIGEIMIISCSLTNFVDLILDALYCCWKDDLETIKAVKNSWFERMFLVILNISSCLTVLLLRDDENIPYIYSCTLAFQYVASLAAILLLCHKLEPIYFPSDLILFTILSYSLASISSMLGFGHSLSYWPNIVSFFLFGIFLYYLLRRMMVPWLVRLRTILLDGGDISIDSLCCLWYSLSATVILVMVPGVVALTALFDWCQFTSADIFVLLYSFLFYGMIINNVPGKLEKTAASSERRAVEIKQALIRYLSHEVRSPLNVIYSGITFMQGDVASLNPSSAKDMIIDSLTAVSQACQDVLQALNDMLHKETIHAGSFSVEREMVPCKELLEMAEHCCIVARQKGVHFSVIETVSFSAAAVCPEEAIEEGLPVEVRVSNVENLALFADKTKLAQVMRNLITNAVKFTPVGQSISVVVRPSTSEDLLSAYPNSKEEDKSKNRAKSFLSNSSSAGFVGYHFLSEIVVEVADSGCGIDSESQSRLLKAFTHFNANELQGGGGTGLGLWISQEIMKKHDSRIQFFSEGAGKGCKFSFSLPMFELCAAQVVEIAPESLSVASLSRFREPRVSAEIQDASDNSLSRVLKRQLAVAGVCKVLVVDDSPMNLKFLVRHIQAAAALSVEHFTNLEVVQVCDGKDAVACVEEDMRMGGSFFDVVFMDNIMLTMHGPEAARRMRGLGYGGLIVGVTGNVLAADVKEYLEAGADHILPKPVTTDGIRKIFLLLTN